MGGESSKSDDDGRVGRRRSVDAINAVFVANAARLVGGQKVMTRNDFIKLFDDCQELGQLMYTYMCRQHGFCATGLKAADFVTGVRDIVDLGGESNQMDFYFSVFSDGQTLTQNDIQKMLRLCCDADWSAVTGSRSSDSDPVFVSLAQNALGASNQSVNSMRFRSWCINNCPVLFNGLHNIVLSRLAGRREAGAAGKSDENSLVESCQSKHSIVSTSWMWFLSCLVGVQFIPHHTDSAASATRLMKVAGSGGWHAVYNSNSQGLSVNRFEHHVVGYRGPTFLFISFQNFLFLLAVDCPWKESRQRWGGENCMFVQLRPEYKISRTGSGLVFFNLSDRTITKGVSVGQERTVVLSVDGELEKVNYLGVDYSLHTLEVWGCGGMAAQDGQQKQKAWEQRAVAKEADRKLAPEGWRESADRELLELGGVETHRNDRQEM